MRAKEYKHKGVVGCRCGYCFNKRMSKKKGLNGTRNYIKKVTRKEIQENENDTKTLRVEVFQEIDIDVPKNLIGMELEKYIDRKVAADFPGMFRSDWWEVQHKEIDRRVIKILDVDTKNE